MSNIVETVILPVGQLHISHRNPRTISPESLKTLMEEITRDPEFLLKRPILVNKIKDRHTVYAGAQRLTACIELGMTHVPVRVEEDLPKEILDYRMLIDNKHRGEFDASKLIEIEGAAEIIATIDEYRDGEFNITPAKNKAQKLIYTKLYFNTREELNEFYAGLEELTAKYPDETMSQKLINHMSETL